MYCQTARFTRQREAPEDVYLVMNDWTTLLFNVRNGANDLKNLQLQENSAYIDQLPVVKRCVTVVIFWISNSIPSVANKHIPERVIPADSKVLS
jgi:hypothetical protein